MYSSPIKPNELYHYGIKRRSGRYPWGSGDRPYQSLENTMTKSKNPKELSDIMKTFSYSNYTKLQSPEETFEKRSGSCHDQVVFELEELGRMGLNPKAEFLIEYNPNTSNGGTTHSFVYYEANGKTYWFENAWSGKEGIHEFDNLDSIKNYIITSHKNGEFGSKNDFPSIEFSNFGRHETGETLQELVDKALSSNDLEYSENQLNKMEKLKHSEGEVNFKMNEFYYLAHGGPGSGRYPLGSGDRPYQKYEGSRGGSSGISGYIRSVKAKKEEKKMAKATKEAQKKEAEEAERKRILEADKERVLRSGKASEVMRYQGLLTNQELQNAFTRLNLESQIGRLSQAEVKSSMDKIDNIMKTVKTGTEWAKIGTDTYNTIAAIYNATPEGQKKPLTLVNKGGGGDKKK